jgi:hypothetical protein
MTAGIDGRADLRAGAGEHGGERSQLPVADLSI